MKALVTVPHTGTRYVVACVRAGGEIAVDGEKWNGRFNVVPYMHFHSRKLPEPERCVTTLRSPIEVLASHDQDRRDGKLPALIKSWLRRCYDRQIEWIDRGAKALWLSDLGGIGQALEVPVKESPTGARDYPLKASLAKREIGQWKSPLLAWWLDEMGHVDARYATLGCEVWWR